MTIEVTNFQSVRTLEMNSFPVNFLTDGRELVAIDLIYIEDSVLKTNSDSSFGFKFNNS